MTPYIGMKAWRGALESKQSVRAYKLCTRYRLRKWTNILPPEVAVKQAKTLRDIGNKLGISAERVRQIIFRMRRFNTTPPIQAYFKEVGDLQALRSSSSTQSQSCPLG